MNGLNGLNADRGRSPVVRFPATGGAGRRRGGRPTPQRTTARAGERPVGSGCRAATATAVSPATFDDANRTRARRPRSSAAPTPTPTPSSAPRRTFECASRDSPCSGSFSRRSRSALAGHFALRSRRRGLTAFGFAVHGSLRSPLTLFETLLTVASRYAPSGTPASSEGPAVPRAVGARRRRRSEREVGRARLQECARGSRCSPLASSRPHYVRPRYAPSGTLASGASERSDGARPQECAVRESNPG